MKLVLSCVIALAPACVVAAKHEPIHDPAAAAAAFDTLKSLAGKWRGEGIAGNERSSVDLQYEVVSAGTAVMERLFVGTPHEMITMYHRDGDRLVLTHYCSVGNQPSMELLGWTASPETVMSFGFTGASNWPSTDSLVMHDARLVLTGNQQLSTTWSAWNHGKLDHSANFTFSRVP